MRIALFVTCFNDTMFPAPARPWCRCWNAWAMP